MADGMSVDRDGSLHRLPPVNKTFHPPVGGWKQHTLYLVHVSYRTSNPIHVAYLKVGFLDSRGWPAGYSTIWNNNCGEKDFREAHFLRVINELHNDDISYG